MIMMPKYWGYLAIAWMGKKSEFWQRLTWAAGDFSTFPEIEIRDSAEINRFL
jgi:hypothetical protein